MGCVPILLWLLGLKKFTPNKSQVWMDLYPEIPTNILTEIILLENRISS